MNSSPRLVRTRLSAMMFLEFFVWACWYVPIGGYLNSTLHFTGPQIGWVFSTTALGGILAPLFVGFIADRLFATERVLATLHFLGGVCLILAAEQKTFLPLIALMMVNALCYMPTMALANSLAFRNIANADSFPRIAVWGTFGWIASGLLVGIVLGGTEKWFFYLAGGAAIVMGLYSLTLPHTPPKGAAGGDVLGLGALELLKRPRFRLFALAAFLICIPAGFYFSWANGYMVETDRPVPTALMTLAQFSEIFVMITMPWFIGWLGLESILAIGMFAWAGRFLLFGLAATPGSGFPLVLGALLVHGFCYCFVFVGAYIYVDKQAPTDVRASAQSLISFLMLGVGLFCGSTLAGYVAEWYPPVAATMPAQERDGKQWSDVAKAPLPAWNNPAAAQSAWAYLDLSSTFRAWLSGAKSEAADPDLATVADTNRDGVIVAAEFAMLPGDCIELGKYRYRKAEVADMAARAIENRKQTGRVGPEGVTRSDWVAMQLHRWPAIWAWPMCIAAAAGAMFWIGSRRLSPAPAAG